LNIDVDFTAVLALVLVALAMFRLAAALDQLKYVMKGLTVIISQVITLRDDEAEEEDATPVMVGFKDPKTSQFFPNAPGHAAGCRGHIEPGRRSCDCGHTRREQQ
jgi:hypothetical protein